MARYILAAGGTGGHIFPALAVAEKLNEQGHEALLFTDKRGQMMVEGKIDYRLILSASPFQAGLMRKIKGLILVGLGFLQSFAYMLASRPASVVGFGGYPSFGPVLAAKLLGIRSILHEQNAVMGRANRLLSRLTNQTALSFTPTAHVPHHINATACGMPVRQEFFAVPAYKASKTRCHILVIGGSLGARLFADIIPGAVAQLPDDVKAELHITQQARQDQLADLDEAYRKLDITAQTASFFHDMPRLLAGADLIISRAGASSVAEIAASGRPSILVPFAGAMDDHQKGNARILSESGGALLIEEADFTSNALNKALTELVSAPQKREAMAKYAKAKAAEDAASHIVSLFVPQPSGAAS